MARIHIEHRRGRRAFTIVEMLVASALILFMMWIIASAFQSGLESFRMLKTAGDMQEKLRAAATAIRRDLTRPHFEASSSETWGGEDLGSQRMDDPTNWKPPTKGYFRVFSSGNRAVDGLDPDDSNPSPYFRVADTTQLGDVLQFTVKLRGLRRDQMFLINVNDAGQDTLGVPGWGRLHRFSYPLHTQQIAAAFPLPAIYGGGSYPGAGAVEPPATYFTTQWADVTYFLRPNNSSTASQQLFTLYRRQNLLVTNLPEQVPYMPGPTNRPLDVNPNDPRYFEVSTWQNSGALRVNGPAMITAPCRRFGVNPADPAGRYSGLIPRFVDQVGSLDNQLTSTDLLMTDVTDFAVKLLWEPTPAVAPFGAVNGPQPTDITSGFANPDFPFDALPQGNNGSFPNPQRIFDTWSQRVPPAVVGTFDDYSTWNTTGSAKTIPIKIRVRAIQITLRIWDVKSHQTRQISIIQDL